MILNGKEKFLIRKTEEGYAEAYYDLFRFYKTQGNYKGYTHGLWYLKQFLLRFHPNESMKIFAEKEGREFTEEGMKDDYLHLVRLVAAMHYDCKEYESGVYWARKAIDLFDFFYCKLNNKTREKIKQESEDYICAMSMFESYKDYFDEDLFKEEKGIHFNWENEYYLSRSSANDK